MMSRYRIDYDLVGYSEKDLITPESLICEKDIIDIMYPK